MLILIFAPLRKIETGGDVHPPGSAASIDSRSVQLVLVRPQQSLPPTERLDIPAIPTSVAPAEIALPDDSTAGPALHSGGERPRARNPLVWDGFGDQRLAAGLIPLAPGEALAEALSQPKGYVSPLRQCYDSIDAQMARARRAQDLSVTDRRGWRWGLSADGVHLGPVTLPIRSGQDPSAESDWRPPRDPCVDR